MKRLFTLAGVFVICFVVGVTASALINDDHPLRTTISGLFKPANKTILLIGVDARKAGEPSRSDTIMVASCNPRQNRVDIISVPRDTRVLIKGQSRPYKINRAHALGGPELLQSTVEDLLHVPIDGWAEVDFKGFEKMIDIMGGVTIDVEKRMYYPAEGINLQSGIQKLEGSDALAYVRYRSDGLGDIGRVERQQKFVKALGDQVFSVRGIVTSPALVTEGLKYTDTNLQHRDILTLAGYYAASEDVTINTYTLPGKPKTIGGGSYWVADEAKTKELLDSIRENQ
ncbi:MAG: LCP family protein [Syntrophomonadaceae bacterium]|nr:LCP family protein [Syntrophomonadaceae bacterium]